MPLVVCTLQTAPIHCSCLQCGGPKDWGKLQCLERFTEDIIRQSLIQLNRQTTSVDEYWRKKCVETWAQKYAALTDRVSAIEEQIIRLEQAQPRP